MSPGRGGGAEIIIEEQPARIEVQQQSPDVTVEQPAPDVTVTKPAPDVQVQQAPPEVKMRDAAPSVSVQDQGQPDVTVRQTEQPSVQVGEPAAGAGTTESTVRSTTPPPVTAGSEPAPETSGMLMSKTVGEIKDMKIVNRTGEEIGDVDRVVRENGSQRLFAVTSVGGFLGIGATDIAMGLDEMNLRGDTLVAPVIAGEDRLEERYAYDESRFTEVEDNTPLGQSTGSAATAGTASSAMPSFDILDQDRDGYISQQEASASPTLNRAWPRVDADNDGRVDQAEFSAFETGPIGR